VKVFIKLIIYLFIFVILSCRETLKEDSSQVEAGKVEEVVRDTKDSLLIELDEASKEVEKQVKELEEALKDLDNN